MFLLWEDTVTTLGGRNPDFPWAPPLAVAVSCCRYLARHAPGILQSEACSPAAGLVRDVQTPAVAGEPRAPCGERRTLRRLQRPLNRDWCGTYGQKAIINTGGKVLKFMAMLCADINWVRQLMFQWHRLLISAWVF